MPRVLYTAIGVVLLLISAPLLTRLGGKSALETGVYLFFGAPALLAGVLLTLHGATPALLRRLLRPLRRRR